MKYETRAYGHSGYPTLNNNVFTSTYSSSSATSMSNQIGRTYSNSNSTSNSSYTQSDQVSFSSAETVTQFHQTIYGRTISNITDLGSVTNVISQVSEINSSDITSFVSDYGRSLDITNVILTTTNTGVGSTTLNTNTTYANNVNTATTVDSSFQVIDLVSYTENNTEGGRTVYGETVGLSTVSSTTSWTNETNRTENYFETLTATSTVWASFESQSTSTYQGALSFYYTGTYEVSRFGTKVTETTTFIGYTSCQSTFFKRKDYGYTYTNTDIENSPEASSQLIRAQHLGTRATIQPFVSSKSAPLEGAFIYTQEGAHIDWFNHPVPFSIAFKSSINAHAWTYSFDTVATGTYQNVYKMGAGLAGQTLTLTTKTGATLTAQVTYLDVSSLDTTYYYESTTNTNVVIANGTVLLRVDGAQSREYGPNTTTGSTITTVPITTVIKTDPLNYETVLINSSFYTSSIIPILELQSSTSINTDVATSSFQTSSSNTASNLFTYQSGASYNSQLYSGSFVGGSQWSISKDFGSTAVTTRYEIVGRNIADSQVNNTVFGIMPDYKKGFIGFLSSSFYEQISTEFKIPEINSIILTTTYMSRNSNVSAFALQCVPFRAYEEASASRTRFFYESFSYKDTKQGYTTYEDFTTIAVDDSYTTVAIGYSAVSTEETYTFSQSYTPIYITSISTIDDQLQVISYTAFLRNSSEDLITTTNELSISLLNSCSNTTNYRVGYSTCGGYYPESTLSGTLFYKGLFHGTFNGSSTTSTFSLFNSALNYDTLTISHGDVLVLKGKAVCHPSIGDHYEVFS